MASQSVLKVTCTADPADITNRIDIHDHDTAIWHHGAARAANLGFAPFNTAASRAVTANSATIHFAAGQITAADVRRPITALRGTAHLFKGGTFIKAFNNATTATLSQTACATAGTPATTCTTTTTIPAKVEHTNNRWLVDATCAAGTSTITTTAPGFAPTDLNKSVSGGPMAAGTFISVAPIAGALTATLNQPHTAACTTNNNGDTTANPDVAPIVGADKIQIGAGTYSGGVNVWNSLDPMTLMLSRTTGGGLGFTCAGGNVLGMTALSKADTGGFVATDVGLATSVRRTSGATVTVTAGKIASVSLAGNTTATLAAGQCPALVAPTAVPVANQAVVIGVPTAGAPVTNDAMMTLSAELNLSPTLVATQDDCNLQTLEGFQVVGGWVNPGATYAANSSTPVATVAQILFPTSVISFNGFVAPKKGGETQGSYTNTDPHYTFSFPLLPTSLAECIDKEETASTADDHPLNATGLAFAINSTTMSKAPFLPTGSGNLGDPTVRNLLGVTGAQTITVQQTSNVGPTIISTDDAVCTIVSNTAAPGFTCGDG